MFGPRKKRKVTSEPANHPAEDGGEDNERESTEIKLAILASLHPGKTQEVLLDYLLAYEGSVDDVCQALSNRAREGPSWKRPVVTGYQSSLTSYAKEHKAPITSSISLTKKGRTLHLFSPEDIEQHTPCSIIHNFLTPEDADALLKELLAEVSSFRRDSFQLFDRTVESPHSMRFYVDSTDEAQTHKTEYVYNGSYVPDVAKTTPEMLRISKRVCEAVNKEIERRICDFQVDGKKLKFQSPDPWAPNASFVNCYDGGKESVGYHSDQLTYLGPRAVIGSLSLGVAREFRVRKIVPQADSTAADKQGQIAIHLPHNSLLIMHAEMQEEWKHSIPPAQTITPHPVAGNKRLNITYRCYKQYLHPMYTPKCKCNIPAVLRCVQKRAVTRGRYMWMCHAGYTPGQKGCNYFEWALFDEDGKPPWVDGYKGNANLPAEALKDI